MVGLLNAASRHEPKDAEEAMKVAESQLAYGLYDDAEGTLMGALSTGT